jgi:hypothetical protein
VDPYIIIVVRATGVTAQFTAETYTDALSILADEDQDRHDRVSGRVVSASIVRVDKPA